MVVAPTSTPMQTLSIAADGVAYTEYSKLYDKCVADTFAQYAQRFRSVHLLVTFLTISLLSLVTVMQSLRVASPDASHPVDNGDLITAIAGSVSLLLRGIEQQISLPTAAQQCNVARADIMFYLTSKRPMPSHVQERILQTQVLWYAFPKRCAARRTIGTAPQPPTIRIVSTTTTMPPSRPTRPAYSVSR